MTTPPVDPEVAPHWLTLRFPRPEVEAAFRAEHAAQSVISVRLPLGLGVVLYGAFGALDLYLIPEALTAAWVIRFGVICPLLALVLGFSYTRFLEPRLQPALAGLAFLCGAGIVAMMVIARGPGRDEYYAGLLLVSALTFTAVRLRFLPASLVAWATTGLYVLTLPLAGERSGVAVLTSLVFLVSFNAAGMAACFSMERALRFNYLQRRTIAAQADGLAEALGRVKVLSGLLPVCAWCRKVRSDGGYWQQLEAYVARHSDASFTHGICPDCADRLDAGNP